MPNVQQSATDEHVFLMGRPPMGEFLGFVAAQTANGQTSDFRPLADEWRSANDHIRQLEKNEAGWADEPPIEKLPGHLQSLQDQVLADPVFQRSFSFVPTTVGIVELDRLVVFQKQINLEYVKRIKDGLGLKPNEEAIFRTCLPVDHPLPPLNQMRIANNAFVFVSPSTDLRFLESILLEPTQVSDYPPPGPIAGVVGLVFGFSFNTTGPTPAPAATVPDWRTTPETPSHHDGGPEPDPERVRVGASPHSTDESDHS